MSPNHSLPREDRERSPSSHFVIIRVVSVACNCRLFRQGAELLCRQLHRTADVAFCVHQEGSSLCVSAHPRVSPSISKSYQLGGYPADTALGIYMRAVTSVGMLTLFQLLRSCARLPDQCSLVRHSGRLGRCVALSVSISGRPLTRFSLDLHHHHLGL